MKIVNKLKKKGYKGHTGTRRQKPWENFGRKRQKLTWNGLVEQEQWKMFEKVLKKCEEHMRKDLWKHLQTEFWLVEN